MKHITTLIIALLAICSVGTSANYNANFSGKITHVLTYTSSSTILLRIESMPGSDSESTCSQFDYMQLDPNISEENKQYVFARILTAYASGEVVNIGYDKIGSCTSTGRMTIYRVG